MTEGDDADEKAEDGPAERPSVCMIHDNKAQREKTAEEEARMVRRKCKRDEVAAQKAAKAAKLEARVAKEDEEAANERVRAIEWEAEKKRIIERMNEEKKKRRREMEERVAADRKKAVEEVGEELMGDADAMWAEVAAYEKSQKKRKKPRHGK